MVGRLNLQNVSDDDPLEMNFKAERTLDSPDSGLPPSPSPSPWLLPVASDRGSGSLASEDEGKGSSAVSVRFQIIPPKLSNVTLCRNTVLDLQPRQINQFYRQQVESNSTVDIVRMCPKCQ